MLLPLSGRGGKRLAVCAIQRCSRWHAAWDSRDWNECRRRVGRDGLKDTVDAQLVAIGAFAVRRIRVPTAANLETVMSATTRDDWSGGASHLYLSLPAVATSNRCSLPWGGLLRRRGSHLRAAGPTSRIVAVRIRRRVSVLIILGGVRCSTAPRPGRRALVVLLFMILPPLVIWLTVIISWALASRLDWRKWVSTIRGWRVPIRVRRRLG